MKIYAQNCLIGDQFVPALIEVQAGVITKIQVVDAAASDENDHNFEAGYLIPGLIDLQINGAAGVDFSNCDKEQAIRALQALAINGTTSVCPTVITSPIGQINKQVEMLSGLTSTNSAARNLGVHLEGPVLSATNRGAHQEELLLSPEEFLSSEVDLNKIRILTLAPELKGASKLIELATTKNVLVSLGHTNASADETHDAIEHGARMVTHLFNGMRPIHQREPGIITKTLMSEQLHFGIILDGEHVDYELVNLALKIAGNRMVAVSDASAALLSEPGEILELGGTAVFVDESGTARREDGTIASSGMTQLQAIENAVSNGLDRAALINAATKIAADLLSQKDLGRIAVGAKADLVHYESNNKPRIDFVTINGELCLS